MTILEELQKAFPDCWFKAGKEFDGSSTRLVWSGEGSEINGLPAFDCNAWEHDSHEQTYTMCVHNDLNKFAESCGCYWEAHDGGTFFLYKV